MTREVDILLSVFQFESSVAVRDRVAFACMFLSDAQVTQLDMHDGVAFLSDL